MNREALVTELTSELIDSFEKLDLLLQLSEAGNFLGLSELEARLHLPRATFAPALEGLIAAGVVTRRGDDFAMAQGPWTPHVRALVSLYREDRMQVAVLMSQAAIQRLRTKADRAFADAFVFGSRKGKRDG
jgi:DNA-binding IclR family transcriptional regulator